MLRNLIITFSRITLFTICIQFLLNFKLSCHASPHSQSRPHNVTSVWVFFCICFWLFESKKLFSFVLLFGILLYFIGLKVKFKFQQEYQISNIAKVSKWLLVKYINWLDSCWWKSNVMKISHGQNIILNVIRRKSIHLINCQLKCQMKNCEYEKKYRKIWHNLCRKPRKLFSSRYHKYCILKNIIEPASQHSSQWKVNTLPRGMAS